jgi:hypothetical protein
MFKTLRTITVALAVTAWGALPAMATEEPVFTLVKKEGSFEIRDYAPVIVAETTLTGSAERARNAGFQPLAAYIFAKDRKGSTIAMTAPVTQAPREQIAMTAPVTQSSAGDSWTISFTMPASYTMETLPTPANPNVRLVPQAARRMAVVRFSGTASAGHGKGAHRVAQSGQVAWPSDRWRAGFRILRPAVDAALLPAQRSHGRVGSALGKSLPALRALRGGSHADF